MPGQIEPNEPPIDPAQTPEEMRAEIVRLRAHSATILSEKKGLKTSLDEQLAITEKKRQDDLMEKEDHKTALDEALVKIGKLETTITEDRGKSFQKSIALKVQGMAKDAHDPSDIIGRLKTTDENVDLENETILDLSEQIDALRKEKPYLFGSQSANMTTKLPNVSNRPSAPKALKDLSVDEIKAQLKTLG